MEKLTTNSDDAIRLERNPPQGFMWGFLHTLKYNRWRYTNKTLLHHINHSSNLDFGNGGFDEKDETFEDWDEKMKKKNDPSEENEERLKDRSNNWVAIKRFKNIGQKIKHLMVFDKREKRRIAMDGVLDKIPKDQGISDEIKSEVILKLKNCAINPQHNRLKRASSLNESMEKYSKLFWSFNNCETKHDDGLKLRRQKTSLPPDEGKNRSLGRILSLPNFSSYFLHGEDSVNSKTNSRVSSVDGKNDSELNLGLRFQQQLESETKDENSKDNELFRAMNSEEEQERFDSMDDEIVLDQTVNSDPIIEEQMIDNSEGLSIPKDTKFESATIEIDENDSKLTTEPEPHDKGGDPETLRSRVGDSIQVKPRDLELFNYVRDVLELSGFGVCPFRDQTLDPLMFGEDNGRNLLKNPKCGGGAQMHIFDLINEVLIDIHQRSGTYWPRPLTSHCHVHPMPSGHHVLEEVWGTISSYLKPDHDPTLDYIVRKELGKRDGWMHLQFEGECAGLELEESMFEDLLDELMFDDLLEQLTSLWYA